MRSPASRTSPHVEVITSLTIFVRFQKKWTKFLTSQLCLLMIVDIDESYPTATATPPRPRRDPPPTDRHRPPPTDRHTSRTRQHPASTPTATPQFRASLRAAACRFFYCRGKVGSSYPKTSQRLPSIRFLRCDLLCSNAS
jgi:hypothetical protein